MFRFPIVPNEYYHIYNRGVDKRQIFLDDSDYFRFMVLLYATNSTKSVKLSEVWRKGKQDSNFLFNLERKDTLVHIGAFCLMPNHFHLLIKIPEYGDINNTHIFMKKLLTGYSMYFNKRRNRSGVLFESRYKSKWIDNDNYLKYIFSYIHLNPVKLIRPNWQGDKMDRAELKDIHKYLSDYKYSSYLDYAGSPRSDISNILNKQVFPDYFATGKHFIDELNNWLNFFEKE